MGLRSLESGEAPPLGARLGTDTPAWDEPAHGELRDWDMLRGFVVGGLGVTWRHVPRVAMAALLLAVLLAACCLVPAYLRRGCESSARSGASGRSLGARRAHECV